MRKRDAFGSHGVAPSQPVILLGIDERAVEIPEDGFSHAGDISGGQGAGAFRFRISRRIKQYLTVSFSGAMFSSGVWTSRRRSRNCPTHRVSPREPSVFISPADFSTGR